MRRSYVVIFVGCILGAATPAAAGPEKDVVVTIQDARIIESSGLIARDGDFLTVNDSGDSGRVFVVDGKTGQTIGVTSWSDAASDVEAIAPAGGDRIWVGDIGDNNQERRWIEVTRVPVQKGDRLIARKGDFLTVNDSGDKGQVFVVDGETGKTIGVTFWSASAKDVEAIAPADGKDIWIGDIGDNKLNRPWIEVTRLPVDEGDRAQAGQTFRLAYPDGARDAEALLVHPVTGRVYVATKLPLVDGQLYEAPETLDPVRVNRLKSIGEVGSFITDGAFFPDGRHLILRGYGRATIYSFPKLKVVGSIDLPQRAPG